VDGGIALLRVTHELQQPSHPVETAGRGVRRHLALKVDVAGEVRQRGVEVQAQR
jgi:hypothetical protein